ncbi:MAG: helix-turn-helix domain-containing protein [Thermoanaerobaculia bacterium]
MCLTQEQFAEALGISVHTLRNWEQDRVRPDGPGLATHRGTAPSNRARKHRLRRVGHRDTGDAPSARAA